MKRIIFLTVILFVMSAFSFSQAFAQPMGPGMMGPGYGYGQSEGWNYCPYCGGDLARGGYGMGHGRMGGGYGMGPGMMGPQYYGPQPGQRYQGPRYQEPQKPMDEKEAKGLLENYLQSTRNPNLKLGKIEDKGESFEAEIQTKDGSLIDKIVVDKRSGWMRSVY
ncbi:MAG: hypothetical protein ACOWYE_01965 [Desulfatiglandales bacterium]